MERTTVFNNRNQSYALLPRKLAGNGGNPVFRRAYIDGKIAAKELKYSGEHEYFTSSFNYSSHSEASKISQIFPFLCHFKTLRSFFMQFL